MPRFRRTIRPGDLVHVICRFINQEFRLTSSAERDEYLHRLGKGITDSDWRLLSYALMSSHIHLALVAGLDLFGRLFKTVNSPFSNWLNTRQVRLGPVFAGRPDSIITSPALTGRLIAYHHNNPPRAHVVEVATDSDWTSHRAYMGRAACPEWLDVELGLELMGFGSETGGRGDFERYVLDHKDNPR
ncbi:MAG: hypothetical protein JRH11_05285, partial [Deltaproteobacteria bacterium]|nr:hypothetical protein [Deltaproteobacteria bacterium]